MELSPGVDRALDRGAARLDPQPLPGRRSARSGRLAGGSRRALRARRLDERPHQQRARPPPHHSREEWVTGRADGHRGHGGVLPSPARRRPLLDRASEAPGTPGAPSTRRSPSPSITAPRNCAKSAASRPRADARLSGRLPRPLPRYPQAPACLGRRSTIRTTIGVAAVRRGAAQAGSNGVVYRSRAGPGRGVPGLLPPGARPQRAAPAGTTSSAGRASPRPTCASCSTCYLGLMHPWHDCYVDDALVEAAFPVIIEVPNGARTSTSSTRKPVCCGSIAFFTAPSITRPTTASSPARSATTATRSTRWCSARSRCIR